MRQLTSPPTSARRFAEWLISTLNYPPKELASVALLLSEAKPKPFVNPRTKASTSVATPTIDALRDALQEWRSRGDTRPDQRLLFYFSGHGIARGNDTVLLAADYGADPYDELDGAIDFRNFLEGMRLSRASEQVYFIDACRVGSANLLNAGGYSGRPIFKPDLGAPPNLQLRRPVFYASIPGASAYGRKEAVSVFTEALLHGLGGGGAISEPEGWKVTGLRLQESIDFQVEPVLLKLGRSGGPAPDALSPIDLHFPGDTPKGTAIIYCDLPAATEEATFSYTMNGEVKRRPGGRRGQWVVELPAAEYEFSAEFPPGSWSATPQRVYVEPVSRKIMLKAV